MTLCLLSVKRGAGPYISYVIFLGLPQLGEACRGIIQRRPPLWEDTRGGESPCSKDPPNDCVRSMQDVDNGQRLNVCLSILRFISPS